MSIALRIAFSIVIAGLFVVTAFIAANYDQASLKVYSILVPLTAFLFFFGLFIGQQLAWPVKKILQSAEPLERGVGRSRLYLKTKDEIGELAKTFNRISEKFEDHRSKIETLDINVKLRTRALEEIIAVLERKVKNRTKDWHEAIEELEQSHALIEIKNKEISDLQSQIAKLAKKDKKTITKKQ